MFTKTKLQSLGLLSPETTTSPTTTQNPQTTVQTQPLTTTTTAAGKGFNVVVVLVVDDFVERCVVKTTAKMLDWYKIQTF